MALLVGVALAACSAPAPTPTVRDCGIEELRIGTGHNEAARQCLLAAFEAGTPATFVSRSMTIEGDPIVRTYLVVSGEEVRIEHDARADRYGSGRIELLRCPRIVPVADWNAAMGESMADAEVFVEDGCQPAGTR